MSASSYPANRSRSPVSASPSEKFQQNPNHDPKRFILVYDVLYFSSHPLGDVMMLWYERALLVWKDISNGSIFTWWRSLRCHYFESGSLKFKAKVSNPILRTEDIYYYSNYSVMCETVSGVFPECLRKNGEVEDLGAWHLTPPRFQALIGFTI